jgi:hypothetical protein
MLAVVPQPFSNSRPSHAGGDRLFGLVDELRRPMVSPTPQPQGIQDTLQPVRRLGAEAVRSRVGGKASAMGSASQAQAPLLADSGQPWDRNRAGQGHRSVFASRTVSGSISSSRSPRMLASSRASYRRAPWKRSTSLTSTNRYPEAPCSPARAGVAPWNSAACRRQPFSHQGKLNLAAGDPGGILGGRRTTAEYQPRAEYRGVRPGRRIHFAGIGLPGVKPSFWHSNEPLLRCEGDRTAGFAPIPPFER